MGLRLELMSEIGTTRINFLHIYVSGNGFWEQTIKNPLLKTASADSTPPLQSMAIAGAKFALSVSPRKPGPTQWSVRRWIRFSD